MFWSCTVGSYRVAALVAFMVSIALCACIALLLITWAEPLLDDFCRASLAVFRAQVVCRRILFRRGRESSTMLYGTILSGVADGPE